MISNLDKLIEFNIMRYPEGLSRGLDNQDKQAVFEQVVKLFNGKRCSELGYGGMTIEREGHLVDHYVSFFDDKYVYYYSQPYGRDVTEKITAQAELNLPPNWECCYLNINSWYYPERCFTIVFRKELSHYQIFQHKVERNYTLWDGVKFNKFDRKERRLIERKVEEVFR